MAFFQNHFSPIHQETNSLLNHQSIDIYTVQFTSTTHLTMVMVYPIELISRVYSSHPFKLQKEHKSRMDTRLSSLSHQFEQLQCSLDYYKNSFHPRTIAQWKISHQKLQHLRCHVHLGNPCEIVHMSNFYVIVFSDVVK